MLIALKLVNIWGKQNQVLEAQNMLQDMLSRLMQQRTLPKTSRWVKIHAHSNTKVAHARSQETHEERLSEMRKPPRIAADYTVWINSLKALVVLVLYED